MTRIKICGITRAEDALLAAELGADAVGFVFYPQSPRNISIAEAKKIINKLPAFVTTVGLFVNNTIEEINTISDTLSLDLLQLHGDESAELCAQLSIPYVKTLKIKPGQEILSLAKKYNTARAILLDTFHAQHPGGTGQVFDWSLIPANLNKPLILAGGLNAENVAAAIKQVNPYAVDVSSGVELSPGIKDASKLTAFFEAVRGIHVAK